MSKFSLTGSAGLFGLRLTGAGVGFLTQVLLAQVLGSHDLGVFYAATSLATVAGFLMSQGYSQIAYRFSARYRPENRARLFRAFVARATCDGVILSTIAAVIVVALAALAPGLDDTTRLVYSIAGATIVPSTLVVLYTNLAGAIRMFGWCYVPDAVVRPIIFLFCTLALYAWFPQVDAVMVMIVFALLFAGVALSVIIAIRPHLPPFTWPVRSERRMAARWRAEARPLVLLSLYTNSFSDVCILFATPFLSMSEIAVVGVCIKLSLLIGYFVQIGQQMAIPDLADAREKGDLKSVHLAVRRAVVLPLAMTIVAFAGCAVIGRQVLGLFGAEFAGALWVLLIMVGSQVLRAAAGPSAHVLTLTGAQGLNALLCFGALAALLVANAILGPMLGAAGAAWAVFISYGGWLIATLIALAKLGEARTDLIAVLAANREP